MSSYGLFTSGFLLFRLQRREKGCIICRAILFVKAGLLC